MTSGRGWRPARLIDPGLATGPAGCAVRIATGHVGMLPVASLAFALFPSCATLAAHSLPAILA